MQAKHDFSEIIIYTSTLYGNDETSIIRSKLCLSMLENARKLGVKVIVKDGGSNEEFINELQKLDNVTLIPPDSESKRKTMGEDRREALRAAMRLAGEKKMKQPCFLWTEPEKDNLISDENLSAMVSEINHGSNIVVPARKEMALSTLPKNQRWFEQRANKRSLEVIKAVLGKKHQELLDLWFGPKMFDRIGAEYFANYNKDGNRTDLWDAVSVPVLEAIKEGKKVAGMPVDYEYSGSQRINETGELKNQFTIKRLEQYAQILKEMGDKKWINFFEETKEELARINELKKEKEIDPEKNEILNETKKNILHKFFR